MLGLTCVCTLASIVSVLIISPTYRSVSLIQPPQSGSAFPMQGLKDLTDSFDGLLGTLLGTGGTGEDLCFSILGSTQFARAVVEHFDFVRIYEFHENSNYYFADVIRKFNDHFGFKGTKESAIQIAFEDEDPDRAKAVVEFMTRLLDSLYTTLSKKSLENNLDFFDQKVHVAENEMAAIEDSLAEFQLRHNLYIPDIQIKSSLEYVVKLETELQLLEEKMKLETQLRNRTSSRYREMKAQKGLLERELKTRFGTQIDSNSLIFPVHILPSLAVQYFHLERAYEIKLAIFKFLVKQVEALKLEAEKNIKQITVVDPPWVNRKRVSPKRRVIVQMVFVLSLIFSSVLALFLEFWGSQRTGKTRSWALAGELRSSLFRLRSDKG